jgi:hypothetical protein
VQGNYLLSNNGQYYPETTTFATLLGNKDPKCPLPSQCVSLIKEYGFQGEGDAHEYIPNRTEPCVDCVVIFNRTSTSIYGHVAIVKKITDDKIYIFERNFEGCGIDSYRWVSVYQWNIKGYLTKNN